MCIPSFVHNQSITSGGTNTSCRSVTPQGKSKKLSFLFWPKLHSKQYVATILLLISIFSVATLVEQHVQALYKNATYNAERIHANKLQAVNETSIAIKQQKVVKLVNARVIRNNVSKVTQKQIKPTRNNKKQTRSYSLIMDHINHSNLSKLDQKQIRLREKKGVSVEGISCNYVYDIELLEDSYKRFYSHADFLNGPPIINNTTKRINSKNTISTTKKQQITYAACQFIPHSPLYFHFPHTYEQLYPCVSWWITQLENNNTSNKVVPVLVGAPSIRQHVKAQHVVVLQEFLQAIHSVFGVDLTIQSISNFGIPPDSVVTPTQPFAMMAPSHAQIMRDKVLEWIRKQGITSSSIFSSSLLLPSGLESTSSQFSGGCYNGKTQPTIGLLNRVKARRIVNMNQIAKAIQQQLNVPVLVYNFTGKSFAEQAMYMNSIDILIAPHGAELTLLPYMPTESCASTLEIFNSGPYVTHYFGSLAASAGMFRDPNSNQLRRYAWYLGRNIRVEQYANRVYAYRNRRRKANMCVNVDRIVAYVRDRIEDWNKCCNNRDSMVLQQQK